MSDDKNEDAMLTVFFDAARNEAPIPSGNVTVRILADADAAQITARARRVAPPARGFLASVYDALGGWPAMAGLSAATVAGVLIGVNPPPGLSDQLSGLLGMSDAAYLIDLEDGAGYDFLEGSS